MKHNNIRQWTLCAMFATGIMAGFTACSDNDVYSQENPDTPSTTPSTVDTKKWTLDQYMDTTYTAGNDYAMYCWGKWYNAAKYGERADDDMDNSLDTRNANLENKYHNQLLSDMKSMSGVNNKGVAELRAAIDKIEEYAQENTPEAAWKAVAMYLASGRNTVFKLAVIQNDDNISEPVLYLHSSNQPSELGNSVSWAQESLRILGYDEEAINRKIAAANDITPFSYGTKTTDGKNKTEQRTDVINGVKARPLNSLTRSGNGIENILADSLGISANRIWVNYDVDQVKLVNMVNENPYGVCEALECAIAEDAPLVNRGLTEDYNDGQCETFINNIDKKLVAYSHSKEFCDKYVTSAMRDEAAKMMEEIRSVFRSRLEKNTWMTQSKDKALEKLNAMEFNVCYPNEWYSEGLPTLKGQSLFDDVCALRAAHLALAKKMLTVTNLHKDMLNVFYGQLDSEDAGITSSTNNAFYVSPTNSTIIMPCNFMSPAYSEDMSDACLYAVMATIGHEITHGFDSSGIRYDAMGRYSDTSWLGSADKAAYDDRTKKLVECYNGVPLGPGSANYNNGQKSLGENIADLGGLELAMEAYTNRLVKEGYTGDELVKQQRRLFQAIACSWREKYTEQKLVENSTDSHASGYARTIGPAKNVDKWYEVFGVKEGDKLYVKPSERVHIW